MGVPQLLLIFIAAIVIAVSLNHLFLSFRISNTTLHITIFLAGLSGFSYIFMVYLGYASPAVLKDVLSIYRYQLLFLQTSFLALTWSFALLYGTVFRKWMIGLLVVYGILILLSIFLPAGILFSKNPSVAFSIVFGSRVTILNDGIIPWRILVDLSVIATIIFGILIVLRRMMKLPSNRYYLLLVVTGILFSSGILDHLADSGRLNMIYFLPLAYFLSYAFLSSASLQQMIDELKRSNELAMKERKWRLMVSEIKLIIVELNTLGQIRYVNPFLLDFTGYKEDELIGKDWFEVLLSPQHSYDVQSAFIEILSNNFHPHYQNPILTKYQQEKMVDWYNVRLRDSKGKISGSVSIGMDISEMVHEKEKLEQSLQEARDLIEKLKQP